MPASLFAGAVPAAHSGAAPAAHSGAAPTARFSVAPAAYSGAAPAARFSAAPAARFDAASATRSDGASAEPTVGLRVLTLVDRSRSVKVPGGHSEPRVLVTYVRYPALGRPGATDVRDAAPVAGEHPVIVFAHGFDVTPAPYARLLESWARAGFVVATPVFPLTNPQAPGGPDERDVVNQPRDVSFTISNLLALSEAGGGPLSGLIDPKEIAVAGHSDGAETALAVAYSRRYRDRRVRAAAVLSGAEMSGIGGYDFAGEKVPLLAAQGTRDLFNESRYTRAYFKAAPAPKYLLWLLGAGHLPPYSFEQPYLGAVETVTTTFFERYLTAGGAAWPTGRWPPGAGAAGAAAKLVSDP